MTYRFGTFEFDTDAGGLRKNGRMIALEPQPARALALLLERADSVVSRDELREAVWGADTHVDFDRGIAYCLSQIRIALGDSAENPRFVQTLPRKGYKFIAPVHRHQPPDAPDAPDLRPDAPDLRPRVDTSVPVWDGGADATSRRSRATPRLLVGVTVAALAVAILAVAWALRFAWNLEGRAGRTIVAVSIFDNETGNPDHDRLVAGLSDLVVTDLTQLDPGRVGVVGNAAVLRRPRNIRDLKAVAAGVKADYVVLGQLQRADPGLRFITHFIRLSDGTHLKANRIAMPDGDVSRLEGAVTAEFERAVRQYVLADK